MVGDENPSGSALERWRPRRTSSGSTTSPPPASLLERGPRAAAVAFALAVAAAFVFYALAGRAQWFFQDEWKFLVERDGGSLDDLMRPHNEHWSTIPVAVYRVLFNVVGLRDYLPYQLLAIGTHLAIAVLLRMVLRRLAVAPWIASAAAGVLLCFGSGSYNIVWGFQIGFSGSIAYGLGHLLLAHHDGPLGRRDVAGLVCGLLALMSSGIGVFMVAGVGLSLLGRGWRRAALHVAPLAAVYLAWFAAYGLEGQPERTVDVGLVTDFALTGIRAAFSKLGQNPLVAVALVGLIVVGIGLETTTGGLQRRRTRLAIPLAFLATIVPFFVLTGIGRAEPLGVEFATRARYSYLTVVLVVPALAVGADVLARRLGSVGGLAAVTILLLGVPGNLADTEVLRNDDASPGMVMALPRLTIAEGLPDGYTPFRDEVGARAITMGFLRDAVRSGRLPDDAPDTARRRAEELVEGLGVVPELRPGAECDETLPDAYEAHLDVGESVVVDGPVIVWVTDPAGRNLPPQGTGAQGPTALVAVVGPIDVTVGSFNPDRPAALCS